MMRYSLPLPPDLKWWDWTRGIEGFVIIWGRALRRDRASVKVVDHMRWYFGDDLMTQMRFSGALDELGVLGRLPQLDLEDMARGTAQKYGIPADSLVDFLRRTLRRALGPRRFPTPVDFQVWKKGTAIWLFYWEAYLLGENETIQEKVAELVRYSDRFVDQVIYASRMRILVPMHWEGVLDYMDHLEEAIIQPGGKL